MAWATTVLRFSDILKWICDSEPLTHTHEGKGKEREREQKRREEERKREKRREEKKSDQIRRTGYKTFNTHKHSKLTVLHSDHDKCTGIRVRRIHQYLQRRAIIPLPCISMRIHTQSCSHTCIRQRWFSPSNVRSRLHHIHTNTKWRFFFFSQ